MAVTFVVVAGKYDGHDRNCKFVGEPHTELWKALVDVTYCQGYPWVEIELYDGNYRVVFNANDVKEIST